MTNRSHNTLVIRCSGVKQGRSTITDATGRGTATSGYAAFQSQYRSKGNMLSCGGVHDR
jgi:hypothetical protein